MIMMGKFIRQIWVNIKCEELGIRVHNTKLYILLKDRDNGELNFNNYTYFSRDIKPTIRFVPSSMK